jgi:hypothetical protein
MRDVGTSPAWYQRLPPALRRVAEASDRVSSLPFRPGPIVVQAVDELVLVLPTGNVTEVQVRAQRIADGVCTGFRVPLVWVRVAERRPHDARGELHGLYVPATPPARDTITLWMRTAKRIQVVAPRTFLRTLLHEVCHHLDYTHLKLRDSLHTRGFYQRESSLFGAIVGDRVDSARALR